MQNPSRWQGWHWVGFRVLPTQTIVRLWEFLSIISGAAGIAAFGEGRSSQARLGRAPNQAWGGRECCLCWKCPRGFLPGTRTGTSWASDLCLNIRFLSSSSSTSRLLPLKKLLKAARKTNPEKSHLASRELQHQTGILSIPEITETNTTPNELKCPGVCKRQIMMPIDMDKTPLLILFLFVLTEGNASFLSFPASWGSELHVEISFGTNRGCSSCQGWAALCKVQEKQGDSISAKGFWSNLIIKDGLGDFEVFSSLNDSIILNRNSQFTSLLCRKKEMEIVNNFEWN